MPSSRMLSDGRRYGTRYNSDGVQLFAVEGLSSNECCGEAAQSLLPHPVPAIGTAHPANPNLVCYDVQLVNDIGSAGDGKWSCIVGAIYRPINWAGAFRANTMRVVPGVTQTLFVPIVTAAAVNQSGETVVFREGSGRTIPRWTLLRTESRTTGTDENDIIAWFQANTGRVLQYGGTATTPDVAYQVLQPSLRKDAGNQKYLDINLLTSAPIPEIPEGTYPGQVVTLPALPPLCEWDVRFAPGGSDGTVYVIDPREIYGEAEACPWL